MTHMAEPSMKAFDEDAEIEDEEDAPQLHFFATGNDGDVIKLHDRMASVPIGFGGQQFQKQLEEEIKNYSQDEVIALAPFELVGRGIAGIEEMAGAMDDTRVLFGLLQIQIGEGTFARYKNIFIHFQGEKMKILARARANRRLALAKELIGHTHAPLVVNTQSSFTLEWVFNELKRVFTGDNIAYKGSGKQQDIHTLRVNYQKRMERAKEEAEEERKRLLAERARMDQEAKQQALEEERQKLEELKREAALKKAAMEKDKKNKAEEERRLRHERQEAERVERKRLKEEQEKKELEEAMKKNPQADVEELKEANKKKKKKRRKGRKKKKDDWSDDRPWTPQRVLAAIHAEMSPVNWGLFKPSQKEAIPIKWGHGSLNELREELKPDEVMYGLMRLSFGSGRFRRSTWVFFVWTPDSMSIVHKKTNKRMKHVSYQGKMQKILTPWAISMSVETIEKVTIKDWILRVKKSIVVDGGDEMFTEEGFRKALEEENKWIESKKAKEHEVIQKQKKEEEQRKVDEMKAATRKRQEMAQRKQSNVFTRVQLKNVSSTGSGAMSPIMSPTVDNDGNFYVNHDVDYDALKAQAAKEKAEEEAAAAAAAAEKKEEEEEEEYDDSSDEDKPKEPSPEPVIELTAEELALLEAERKRKEAIELAKRQENELKYRNVLQAKLVLESVELVKRTGEKLCWVLLAPKP